MISLLQGFTGWIGQHPAVAGALVFVVAMAESLAVVGLAVPGAAVMIVVGALVAGLYAIVLFYLTALDFLKIRLFRYFNLY